MKTKAFLLICLLSGIGLTPLSAQPDNKNGNGSVTGFVTDLYWDPVFCDGVLVDFLKAEVVWHLVTHYKDGEPQWVINHTKCEVTSMSGEVFKVLEESKVAIPDAGLWTWHYNLIGNKGHHYIASMGYLIDFTKPIEEWTLVVYKTICK